MVQQKSSGVHCSQDILLVVAHIVVLVDLEAQGDHLHSLLVDREGQVVRQGDLQEALLGVLADKSARELSA